MNANASAGEKLELMRKIASELAEHFDAVQILASHRDGNGNTQLIKYGEGNWYARQGMAHDFINAEQAQETAIQIAERIHPDGEDDE